MPAPFSGRTALLVLGGPEPWPSRPCTQLVTPLQQARAGPGRRGRPPGHHGVKKPAERRLRGLWLWKHDAGRLMGPTPDGLSQACAAARSLQPAPRSWKREVRLLAQRRSPGEPTEPAERPHGARQPRPSLPALPYLRARFAGSPSRFSTCTAPSPLSFRCSSSPAPRASPSRPRPTTPLPPTTPAPHPTPNPTATPASSTTTANASPPPAAWAPGGIWRWTRARSTWTSGRRRRRRQ